jgi:hypothetical protein
MIGLYSVKRPKKPFFSSQLLWHYRVERQHLSFFYTFNMEQNDQMVHDHAVFINSTVNSVYELIVAIPGSHLAISYLKNAYQNDPFRIALELFLVFFAIKYMLSKKYKPNDNNVVLTVKVS